MQHEVDRLWNTDIQQLRTLLSTYHIDYCQSDGHKSLIWKFLSVLHPELRVDLHMYLDHLETSKLHEGFECNDGEDQQPTTEDFHQEVPPSDDSTFPDEEHLGGPGGGYRWYESWLRQQQQQQQSQEQPQQQPGFPPYAQPFQSAQMPSMQQFPFSVPPQFPFQAYPNSHFNHSVPFIPPGPIPKNPIYRNPPSARGEGIVPPASSANYMNPYIPFPQPAPLPQRPPPTPVPKVPNYYNMLEIQESCTIDAIKQAYRRMAMKYHPDKNPGDLTAEERFKAIKQAYEVLSDSAQRVKYDAALARYMAWVQAEKQYRAEQYATSLNLGHPLHFPGAGACGPTPNPFPEPLWQSASASYSNMARPKPYPSNIPHAWTEEASSSSRDTDACKSARSRNSDSRDSKPPWHSPPPPEPGADTARSAEPYISSELNKDNKEPQQPQKSRRVRRHMSTGPEQDDTEDPLGTAAGPWRPRYRTNMASTAPSFPGSIPEVTKDLNNSPSSDESSYLGKGSTPTNPTPSMSAHDCSSVPVACSAQGRRTRSSNITRLEVKVGTISTAPTKTALPEIESSQSPLNDSLPNGGRPSKFRSLLNRFGLQFS